MLHVPDTLTTLSYVLISSESRYSSTVCSRKRRRTEKLCVCICTELQVWLDVKSSVHDNLDGNACD